MLKEKIAQVKELKRLRKEYLVKHEEVYELMRKSSITKFRRNVMLPQRLVAPLWGLGGWPCKLIQTGSENSYWLAVLSGDWSQYSYEFHCPNFNENAPCTEYDCMHNEANHNRFACMKARDELADLGLKIEAAKKRVWGRTK